MLDAHADAHECSQQCGGGSAQTLSMLRGKQHSIACSTVGPAGFMLDAHAGAHECVQHCDGGSAEGQAAHCCAEQG
eukprot:1161773-Pelagomonas_calceolata.AAC.12